MNNRISFQSMITQLQLNDPKFLSLCMHDIYFDQDDLSFIEKDLASQSFDKIMDKANKIFCDALTKNISLKKIFWNNFSQDKDILDKIEYARRVAFAIKNHPQIKEIQIKFMYEDCQFYPSIIAFLECLTGNAPIESLYLDFHTDTPEEFMQNLSSILEKNKSLKTIRLEFSNICASQMRHHDISLHEFGKTLARISTLENLDLRRFTVSSNNIYEFTNALIEMTTLKSLSLSYMKYDDKSIPVLCEVLKKNQNLETLKLSEKLFSQKALKTLLETLPYLQHLNQLVIDEVEKITEGIESITKIMHQLKIESLNIKGCYKPSIIQEYGDLLAPFICNNVYLKKLHIGYIDDNWVQKCIPMLSNPDKCHLREFYIAGSFPDDKTHLQLIKAMEDNPNLIIYAPPSKFDSAERKARNKNIQLSKVACLDQSIEFANVSCSKAQEKKSLSHLPLDVLFLIFKMAWNHKYVYFTPADLFFYHQLHLQNFSIRRRLIEEKKYDPKNQKDVHDWWFHEMKPKEEIAAYIGEKKVLYNGFFKKMVQNAADSLEAAKFVWRVIKI